MLRRRSAQQRQGVDVALSFELKRPGRRLGVQGRHLGAEIVASFVSGRSR